MMHRSNKEIGCDDKFSTLAFFWIGWCDESVHVWFSAKLFFRVLRWVTVGGIIASWLELVSPMMFGHLLPGPVIG